MQLMKLLFAQAGTHTHRDRDRLRHTHRYTLTHTGIRTHTLAGTHSTPTRPHRELPSLIYTAASGRARTVRNYLPPFPASGHPPCGRHGKWHNTSAEKRQKKR